VLGSVAYQLSAAGVALITYVGLRALYDRATLPFKHEVRMRRKGAKWRRQVFSFGRSNRGNKIRDTGR
jgi:hypothetical protein